MFSNINKPIPKIVYFSLHTQTQCYLKDMIDCFGFLKIHIYFILRPVIAVLENKYGFKGAFLKISQLIKATCQELPYQLRFLDRLINAVHLTKVE